VIANEAGLEQAIRRLSALHLEGGITGEAFLIKENVYVHIFRA